MNGCAREAPLALREEKVDNKKMKTRGTVTPLICVQNTPAKPLSF